MQRYLSRRAFAVSPVAALIAASASADNGLAREQQSSTPVLDAEQSTLRHLLGHIPIAYTETNSAIHFADIAGHFAAIGRSLPTSDADNNYELWENLFAESGWYEGDFLAFLRSDWEELTGIDVFQMAAQLELADAAGERPFRIATGVFDETAMAQALEHTGYAEVTLPGARSWDLALSDDAVEALAWESSFLSFMSGENDHVALIGDHTVVFASSRATLEDIVQTIHGEQDSVLANPSFVSIVQAARADIVSAMIVPGERFDVRGEDLYTDPNLSPEQQEQERDALESGPLGTMFPFQLALLGISPGGPIHGEDYGLPQASWQIVLALENVQHAESLTDAIPKRFATMFSRASRTPYSSLMPTISVELERAGETPAVDIQLASDVVPRNRKALYDMYLSKDLRFLYFGDA